MHYHLKLGLQKECKLINENCSAPLIEDLVDYMKIKIPSYGPEINDREEASKRLHEAFRRLIISMTKCNNTITVERPMLKRSKRKLPCVKRTKKEPVLETIYEEQKLLVDIEDEDDSHEVIVRLMLSMSDQSGASDSDLDRHEHQHHNDSDGEDSCSEERGRDSDEYGDVKEDIPN